MDLVIRILTGRSTCHVERDSLCTQAAFRGHLRCLEFAHTLGFPLEKNACHYPTQNGDLEVLKYAHENGCP